MPDTTRVTDDNNNDVEVYEGPPDVDHPDARNGAQDDEGDNDA